MTTNGFSAPTFVLANHIVSMRDGVAPAGLPAGIVEDIFSTHIPAFFRSPENTSSKAAGSCPVVFYAHGGVVSPQEAALYAQQHIAWWLANGIYPVYFVWDTTIFAALEALFKKILLPPDIGAPPTVAVSALTDQAIEEVLRGMDAEKVWDQMKSFALDSSKPGNVADQVASYLPSLKAELPDVEFHAVGHSAGSIFHSYFLKAAFSRPTVEFKTLALLAPAITVADFKSEVQPRVGIGNGVNELSMFSMEDAYERVDNVLGMYHHSLLYLIRNALEPSGTPILGLQTSIDADPLLKNWFGSENAEAIWSTCSDSP